MLYDSFLCVLNSLVREALRRRRDAELLKRLNQIPGFSIPDDAIERRPNVYLAVLKNKDSLNQFLETLDWTVQEILKS